MPKSNSTEMNYAKLVEIAENNPDPTQFTKIIPFVLFDR